ncbi:MAG: efflux RND transporter periplasmic adaptor subunit [Desulfonatronovibrio sp.]
MVFLCLALLIAGISLLRSNTDFRQAGSEAIPKVQVMAAQAKDHETNIIAGGKVGPSKKIPVHTPVNGQIDYVSPRLIQGSILHKNEVILRLDDSNQRLALQLAQVNLARAELELKKLERFVWSAFKEWEKYQTKNFFEPNPLELYETELNKARINLAEAMAIKNRAGLNLDRTVIRAPHVSRVLTADVVSGDRITQGTQVALLEDIQKAKITASVPHSKTSWIDTSSADPDQSGSRVKISIPGQPKYQYREGTVSGSSGQVDTETSTTDLTITLADPYGVLSTSSHEPEIPFETDVRVEITGKTLKDIIPVPEGVLRENATVYIAGEDDLLEIRNVRVERIENGQALISSGIEPGENVIVTDIPRAAQGMKIEVTNS